MGGEVLVSGYAGLSDSDPRVQRIMRVVVVECDMLPIDEAIELLDTISDITDKLREGLEREQSWKVRCYVYQEEIHAKIPRHS